VFLQLSLLLPLLNIQISRPAPAPSLFPLLATTSSDASRPEEPDDALHSAHPLLRLLRRRLLPVARRRSKYISPEHLLTTPRQFLPVRPQGLRVQPRSMLPPRGSRLGDNISAKNDMSENIFYRTFILLVNLLLSYYNPIEYNFRLLRLLN
jgi:hypothetical protein